MKTWIKKLIPSVVYTVLWRGYYALWTVWYSLYPVQPRKIFITSYYGNDYGDNAKYIVEELLSRGDDWDIVWQLKPALMKNNRLPKGVRGVVYFSRQAIYEKQTAGVWINNARSTFGRKRKGQRYIQTWHGGPGIKRVEADVAEELGKRYVQLAKRDSQMCDVILSNSQFMTDLFTRAFWYTGEILPCGTPRNDILCTPHPEIVQKVRTFFGLDNDTKLLLYAPTFRKDKNTAVYDIDFSRCCEALSRRFGGTWCALLRLHPNVADQAAQMARQDAAVIPATHYPDMQELLCAADCLITDYSSSNVDYMLTDRPCFLYARDLEAYRSNRGYYFEFEDFPFPLTTDNDELESAILSFDEQDYAARVAAFRQKTGVWERGIAAKTIADYIEHIP